MSTYLTVKEAADLLGCSTKTVRRRIASGDLQAYRTGTDKAKIRLAEAEVRALLTPVPA